ncbi:MAG: hypothetical protein MR484_03380 [Ruminococcus sp.]|nr:hypothetical protein [Ruminococcus sp.]
MKKQQIFAYACSAALLGTLIGCGQKTEIDQSVPDTIIEVAKTTASSETTSVTSETSGITSSSTGSTTSSGSTNTTTATTIHYAGNPNLTVRRTEAPATQPTVAQTTVVTTIPMEAPTEPVTEAPTEATTIVETTVISTLVAPNGTFAEDDMRFTFDGISVKPGDSSIDFRNLMQGKGYVSTESVDGMQFISYDEQGIKLELVDNDDATLKAITLSNEKASTEKGIHVGSTKSDVEAAYGFGVEEDGVYRYLIDTNGDGENDYQLDFALDGNGVVQSITYCCITVGG